jgi:hypothetical protein
VRTYPRRDASRRLSRIIRGALAPDAVFAAAHSPGWKPKSILQAPRARNVEKACNPLARHIQSIERLAIPNS